MQKDKKPQDEPEEDGTPDDSAFRAFYARIKADAAAGKLPSGDPFPEDLEKMKQEAIKEEEGRLGRPLTEAEKAKLFDDED